MASAKEFPGHGYDLVTFFDCLHDMGDPVGAARHVREVIADDGTWMIVEPMAGDTVEANLNPVGRVFYNASTTLCTPASLSQEVGLALGAQAGRGRAPRRRRTGRLYPIRSFHRDPVQHDPGGPPLTSLGALRPLLRDRAGEHDRWMLTVIDLQFEHHVVPVRHRHQEAHVVGVGVFSGCQDEDAVAVVQT